MDRKINEQQWMQYLETPVSRGTRIVKLDQVMSERMNAFMKSRKVRPLGTRCLQYIK